ncbi:MAG: ATP-binding cassette domain-containing protein [Acidimicrobiia bacterium]|nr:ATP-binding cassette domain-containing protein [Acidimicrobiia bacterium]
MGVTLRARLNGREYQFDDGRDIRIGRDPASDVVCVSPYVSREHAVIRRVGDGWVLEDRGSRSGTYVGDRRISSLPINDETTVRLGDPREGDELQLTPSAVVAAQSVPAAAAAVGANVRMGRPTGVYRTDKPRIRIGRAPDNDVVVDDMLVSRYHAELLASAGAYEIVDLGSHNGTFVDGRRVDRAVVDESNIIGLGHQQFRLVAGTLEAYEDVGTVEFESAGLSVFVGEGRTILDDVTFTLPENCFLAIVGPSGAGKSTLMKALTGFSPADKGTVLYNGRDLYESIEELRPRIGYVPQDDILHPQLTVRKALGFAAELRFPSDVSKDERDRAVDEVMEELGLSHRADLPIHKLSGGQRKRVSVALELITKPSLLFLDEPTSGLDPGFEKSAMELLRELADGGRTVIVVTHSLQSLHLCDRVIFLAPGGTTAYFGPPKDALDYFSQSDYADVFRMLEREQQQQDFKGQFEQSAYYRRYVSEPAARARLMDKRGAQPAPPRPAQRSWGGQLSVLVRRHLAVIAADRGLLLMLILLAPLLGFALFAVLGSGGLKLTFGDVPGKGHVRTPNTSTMNVLFGIVFCVGLVGVVDSFREIVKELPIIRRERSIGMSLSAYLASKLVVLMPFVLVQSTVLTLIAVSQQNGPKVSNVLSPPVLELVVDIAATGLAAMVVGLLISAVVTTSDKATPLMAAVVASSLLLAGVLFDLRDKPGIRELSYLTSSRWGFAAAASSVNIKDLEVDQCHEPPQQSCDAAWSHTSSAWLKDLGALGGLMVVGVGGAAYALRRQDPQPRRKG